MRWIALQAACESAPEVAPLTDATMALAWWALRFTPLVARVEDALVLEVSASERLFGGPQALLQQLLQTVAPLPAPQAHGLGPTSRVALARLRYPDTPILQLPVHTLAAAREHAPVLRQLGIRTWGQLQALPRGGLVRRFGEDLLHALDCALGMRPEVYPWLQLPDVFDASVELMASVQEAPALMFGVRRLLAQLQLWLRARMQGVLALELGWTLDARRANARHVDAHHRGDGLGALGLHTAEATQDIGHLQRLLAERLAHVQLPAPVHTLRLRSLRTQPLVEQTRSLLQDEVRAGDPLHQMAERLLARLGPHSVQQAQLQASQVPEGMVQWQAWRAGSSRQRQPAPIHPDASQLPGWLLPVPLPLVTHRHGAHRVPYHHGPLTLLAGPHRLEAGWLQGQPILRDYFIAHSEHSGLLWIYQNRLHSTPDWYLHGIFA